MNIAIDIQPIVSSSKFRGMGIYTYNLLNELFKADTQNNYYLFNCYGESLLDNEELPANVQYYSFYSGMDHYLLSGRTVWRKGYSKVIGGLFKAFIKKNKIDIFFIPAAFDELICYDKEWFKGVNLVILAHDLIPLLFKKQYLNDEEMEQWYLHTVDFMQSADHLLANSDCTKDDLIKHLHLDEQKITTVYAGVSEHFTKLNLDQKQKNEIMSKYHINGNFIIFPGSDDFRKNVWETMRAYSLLPGNIKVKYQLFITGIHSEDYRRQLTEHAKELGIDKRVLINQFIQEEDLIRLYNCADLLAFTSLYEGFGLPVVEAFRCDTKVLCSDNSSLGEVAQNCAVLVDPHQAENIAEGILKALTREDYSQFQKNIEEKIKKYTWSNAAADTLKAFNLLTRKAAPAQKAIRKIAFFTPLNPIKSGIADYSEDIIDEMSKFCDIDIFIDDDYQPEHIFNKNVAIYNYKRFIEKVGGYDEIIYQMGNSKLHLYMVPYIQKFPGLLVLHDYNLHLMVYSCAMEINKISKETYWEYLRLENQYTEELRSNIMGGNSYKQKVIYDIELNRFVTDYAKKIIVHSDYSRKKLLKKNAGYIIEKINHYAKVQGNIDKNSLRAKYNIPKDEFVLASFGQVAKVKRIMPILRALENILKEHNYVKYYLVGLLLEVKDEIKSFIQKNHLEDKVIITEYMDLEAYVDYINLCDVCINLRYPYFGETSGSLMRILGAGKTALVTDIGAFSEIPDNCCIKISIQDEEEDISTNIMKLIEDPGLLQEYGKNAREYAQEHLNIRSIVQEYLDFIKEDTSYYINEKDLYQIYRNEVEPRSLEKDELYRLSETIAYIIQRGDTKNAGESTRGFDLNINEANTKAIMADIYAKLRKRGVLPDNFIKENS